MSDGTLAALATHLARAMAPLDRAFRDVGSFRALLYTLGWDAKDLPPSYVDIANAALAAGSALENLPDNPSAEQILAVVKAAGDVYRALKGLSAAPTGVDPTAFAAEIGRQLVDYLLVDELKAEAPRWFTTLEALGVITYAVVPAAGNRPAYVQTSFGWDQIPAILSDPGSIPGRVYGWGTPQFAFEPLAELLNEVLHALGLASTVRRVPKVYSDALQSGATGTPAGPVAEELVLVLFDTVIGSAAALVGLALAGLPAEGTALPGMILQPWVPSGLSDAVDLGDGWTFTVRAGTDLAQQLGVVIRPQETAVRYPFAPGTQLPSAGFAITMGFQGSQPALLFGQPGHTRLEIASASVGAEVDLKAGDLEVSASAGTKGLALVLNPADLDGFLGSLLGSGETRIDVPFTLAWSSRTGLSFVAGAGFATALYPHLDLGLLRFDRVDLAVRFVAGSGTTPELDVRASSSFSGHIGPVSFAVDRFGAELAAVLSDGNAGPFDLQLRPLWPTGLGLSLDAGPINGGGFVSFDPDQGRYVGILHLAVFDITVTAIGILDTKDPAGHPLPSPGYSFLVVISADIPPIQLGLGFTLNGVGGLAALNRRLDATALLAAVRKGGVSSVLFDADPVRDASTIVANLSAIFPIAMGRYVFGPMAIIGWGTPTLIHIELAIVVEVPAPVTLALLGQASVVLPNQSAPIIELHVDVAGVYDSAAQTLAVDASLHDSHVAAFALSGDLALRAAFGAGGNFALAVGGLNPHFTAPPGFPPLRRVTVALGQSDNPRVSIEGYLAITSNSRQFGAKAELYAAAGGFNVHGWLSFDALFQEHPFSFEFDFSAGMSLNHGTDRIAGVSVDGVLTGPNPFHVKGSASLSLLFFDISVPFDHTFGDRTPMPELPPADPWPPLHDAIAAVANWSGGAGSTTIALTSAGGASLLAPNGTASLRQTVVPLNRTIDHFGQYAISGPNRFGVFSVLVDGKPVTTTTVEDHFAPGQFENLSQTDQLSRDSFEQMDAGLRLDAPTTPSATVKPASVVYQTKIIDTKWRSRTLPPAPVDRGVQLALGATTAATGTGRLRFARSQPRPSAVVLNPEQYVVATTDTLVARPDIAAGMTKGAAIVALKHAAGSAGLQVVPANEVRTP